MAKPQNNETPVPVWILAPHEEKALRDKLQENTNDNCAEQFIRMGKCTEKHQLLFSYYCKDLKRELLECVAFEGSRAQYDKLRAEYIRQKKAEVEKERAKDASN